jgi:hypothetical protein
MADLELHTLSGWDIAKKIGCHYSGDMNTIDHGGVFYKFDELEHDYVPVVRFYGENVDGATFYETGSVPIPERQQAHVQSPSGQWRYERMGAWESAIKLINDCMSQYSLDDAEKLLDDSLPHVLFDYLLSQRGIEEDNLQWFVHEGDDLPRDPQGREIVRIGVDITENEILNQALREGGFLE